MANPTTAPLIPASDLLSLWTATAEASLRTTFQAQNIFLSTSQTWFDQSAALTRDALRQWTELAATAQAAALKNYQAATLKN